MEIIWYAPTTDVGDGLVLEHGKYYLVEGVSFSTHSGVVFSLVGFTFGEKQNEHYQFTASHFRTRNGKRPDLIRAKAHTKAFDRYGQTSLHLVGFAHLRGVEMVWCQQCNSTDRPSLSPLPYDMFEHV
jgi:hypothetical protein